MPDGCVAQDSLPAEMLGVGVFKLRHPQPGGEGHVGDPQSLGEAEAFGDGVFEGVGWVGGGPRWMGGISSDLILSLGLKTEFSHG